MIPPDRLATLAAFLGACRTASLATVDAHGVPHAANVQYVSDEALRLSFVSSPESAHGRHVTIQPAVAMTIYHHDDQPGHIHGVQLRGRCEIVDAAEVLALYTAKYPFVAQPPFDAALAGQCFYRVTPTWLRWIDNRVRFGFKEEWSLDR